MKQKIVEFHQKVSITLSLISNSPHYRSTQKSADRIKTSKFKNDFRTKKNQHRQQNHRITNQMEPTLFHFEIETEIKV